MQVIMVGPLKLKHRMAGVLAALVLSLGLFLHGIPREYAEVSLRRRAAVAPGHWDDPTRLRVLLVGDVHGQVQNVATLVDELRDDPPFDVVLVAGDVVSIPGADLARWTRQGKAVKKSAARLPVLNQILELFSRLAPRDRVYFVPGNHDPPQLFGAKSNVRGNMHGRTQLIAEGLRLVGWGGCTEAVQRDDKGNELRSWRGFPWTSEKAAAKSLAPLSGLAGEGEQQLLLTHCGPRGSGTTSTWRDTAANPIESGSTSLLDHVRAEAGTLVAVAHGHTHSAGGRSSVGFVPIFNSGPLTDGEYAILTLQRTAEGYRIPAAADGPAIPTVVLRGGKHHGQEGVVARTQVDKGRYLIRLANGKTIERKKKNKKKPFTFKRDKDARYKALQRTQQLKWRVSSFDQRRLPNFLEQATMACDPPGNSWCKQFL